METDLFTQILNALDTGALIAFVILFATGKLMSYKTVELILTQAEERTQKLAKEVLDGMEEKVSNGVLKGMREYNGGKK